MLEDEARDRNPLMPFVKYLEPMSVVEADAAKLSLELDSVFTEAMLGHGMFYHRPSDLYQYVQSTGGVWGPVRPKCKNGIDETPTLNNRCQATPWQIDGGGNRILTPVPILDLTNAEGTTYTDTHARLGCDAMGRSKRDQVRAYMKEILSRTPFVLVQ